MPSRLRRPSTAAAVALSLLTVAAALAFVGRAEGEPEGAVTTAAASGSYDGRWPPGPGAWSSPAANPVLVERCGIDVALLVDRSGSIARAGKAGAMRAAASSVVRALAGTPSRVGVWSFGESSAPAPGDPAHPAAPLLAVGGGDGPANAARLGATIDAIPIDGSMATNWEAGLAAVHAATSQAGDPPDLVLVLTDGRPTVTAGDRRSGATTDVEDVDAGIRAANRLKAGGSRIFAVGIGGEVDATTLGLISTARAWDGGDLGSAGYTLTSFDALSATLRHVVTRLCGGTITVEKSIDDGTGGTRPGADVAFTLAGVDDPTWARAARTDPRGLAVFDLGNLEPTRVVLEEAAVPGFRLLGDRIRCANAAGPPPTIDPTPRGVVVTVGPTDVVSCRFVNRAERVDLALTKHDGGRPVGPGEEVTYRLTTTNAGDGVATGVVLTDTVPDHTSVDLGDGASDGRNDGWTCGGATTGRHGPGTTCTRTLGEVRSEGLPVDVELVVRVDVDAPVDVVSVTNRARVADDGRLGPDREPANNEAAVSTPVVHPPPAASTTTPPRPATTVTTAPAPAPAPGAAEARGAVQVPGGAPAVLPRTGARTSRLGLAGSMLVVSGVLALLAGRGRPRRGRPPARR